MDISLVFVSICVCASLVKGMPPTDQDTINAICGIDKQILNNGIYYLPDPDDCKLFWQCELTAAPATYRIHVQTCAVGTLWSQKKTTCVRCNEALCLGSGPIYPIPSEQCPLPEGPATQFPEQPVLPLGGSCLDGTNTLRHVLRDDPTKFYIVQNNQFIGPVPCGHTVFDLDKCDCGGEPLWPLKFSYDEDFLTSNGAIYGEAVPPSSVKIVHNTPENPSVCRVGNGCAEFNSSARGHLEISFMKNIQLLQFSVFFFYQRFSGNETENDRFQILVSNGAPGFLPSYFILSVQVLLASQLQTSQQVNGPAAILDNAFDTYHCVATTYNGLQFRLYIDGILRQEKDIVGEIATANQVPWTIGREIFNDVQGLNTGFSGRIDELRIYNRALQTQEIIELCNMDSS